MLEPPNPDLPPSDRLLGAHMPTAGGLAKSLTSGAAIGCTAVQLFTGSPRQWAHPPLDPAVAEAFLRAKAETGISFAVAHDSYLINLAAPDSSILDRSRKAFRRELERADTLEIPWVVTHMGAHLNSGEDAGVDLLCESICAVVKETEHLQAGIALETTAGQGTCLGHRFEHIARVLDAVGDCARIGVCLDTCHIFAAGYDIRDEEAYERTMSEFGRVIGFDRLKVIHANDAKKPLGSRVDRHEHIGEGEIGIDAFARLVTDARLRHVPIIIETPDSETMHPVNLGKLRRLAAGGTLGFRVSVRFFGHYRDYAPEEGLQIDIPANSTIRELALALAGRDSRLKGIDQVCRAAVNEEYCEGDIALREGDEIAFIPPMSGGY